MAKEFEFGCQQGQEIFLCSTAFRQTLAHPASSTLDTGASFFGNKAV
jgi:hypothetical protein